MKQKTLIIVKPNVIVKRRIGYCIDFFEQLGMKVIAMKMVWLSSSYFKKTLYKHVPEPYKTEHSEFVSSTPVLAIVLEGKNAVSTVRKYIGHTLPSRAAEGTLRRVFYDSTDDTYNTIHASDSAKSARKEIRMFFNENEIFTYGNTCRLRKGG